MSDYNVYYKVPKGKSLRQMFVGSVQSHEEAIQVVMEYLHETKEVFYKPLLAVINGGKK